MTTPTHMPKEGSEGGDVEAPMTLAQIKAAQEQGFVDELDPVRLVAEIKRLRRAGWLVSTYSVIRPADGYSRAVFDALNVFGEGQL